MTPADVAEFSECIAGGGVALFPADTVYGVAAHPESREAVERLYRLKGRPGSQPAAVMFFALDDMLAALPDLPARTRAAAERLLPGAVTLILPNPAHLFPLACGPAPDRLGVRVPSLEGRLAPLGDATVSVLQSSANPSGGADARRLDHVDPGIRAAVDVALDGGELPGTPSTVVDLGTFEASGEFRILRVGAVAASTVDAALSA